jgi:hypothetical protein
MGFAELGPLLGAGTVLPDAGATVQLVRAGYDAEGVDGFCRGEGGVTIIVIVRESGRSSNR